MKDFWAYVVGVRLELWLSPSQKLTRDDIFISFAAKFSILLFLIANYYNLIKALIKTVELEETQKLFLPKTRERLLLFSIWIKRLCFYPLHWFAINLQKKTRLPSRKITINEECPSDARMETLNKETERVVFFFFELRVGWLWNLSYIFGCTYYDYYEIKSVKACKCMESSYL